MIPLGITPLMQLKDNVHSYPLVVGYSHASIAELCLSESVFKQVWTLASPLGLVCVLSLGFHWESVKGFLLQRVLIIVPLWACHYSKSKQCQIHCLFQRGKTGSWSGWLSCNIMWNYTHPHTHTHARTHAHTHTHTHTHTHADARARRRIHTHAHT